MEFITTETITAVSSTFTSEHIVCNSTFSNDKVIADANTSIEKKKENDSVIVLRFENDILNIILNDNYEDGIVTKTEEYIKAVLNRDTEEQIKTAIMELYLSHLNEPSILTGLLVMIGNIPYNEAKPQCPIMALGLLQNKDISIRDKAIQVFEKWNSKDGIPILKSLRCDKKWLQKYVDKVIVYLERDGLD